MIGKYPIVLQEGDLPNLHRSFATVRPHLPNQHKRIHLPQTAPKVVQNYAWAEDLEYVDSQKRRHALRLIECQETSTIAEQGVSATRH